VVEQRVAPVRGDDQSPAPAAPAVRVQPHICDDQRDPRYGTVTWMDYVVDTPGSAVEVSVSDR
jgi:hypothetical protein